MPFATPKPYDIFLAAIQPTPDEVAAMISDLRAKFKGDWREVVQVTGTPRRTLYAWVSGETVPTPAACRCIWLVWCMVCRPGAVTSTFHLATSGRFTDRGRGDPSTAGNLNPHGHVKFNRGDDSNIEEES